MGSTFSIFGAQRLGSTLSVLGFCSLGSSLSLRSFCRLGSSLSIFAGARFGSGLSVLDYVNLGSSMSVGSIKTARIGDGAEPYTAGTRIDFLYSAPSPVPTPGPKMDFYVANTHTMSMKKDVSVLHGIWEADATITTSDRRLKTNIEPLYRTIATRAKARWSETHTDAPAGDTRLRGNTQTSSLSQAASASSMKQQQDQPIGWLLRELRPVSFKLKSGPEAKYLKFGFIAQELESVFPNLVRTVGEDETKAVASQDLIAVLTLALQNVQKELDDYKTELRVQRERMERLERVVFATQQV